MGFKAVVNDYIKSCLRSLIDEFLKSKEWKYSDDLEAFLEWYEKEKLGA